MKLNSFEHRREPVEGKSCLGAPLKEKASYLGASDQFIALVCPRAGHKAQLSLQVHPEGHLFSRHLYHLTLGSRSLVISLADTVFVCLFWLDVHFEFTCCKSVLESCLSRH